MRKIDADAFVRYADEPSIFDTTDLKAMIEEQPTLPEDQPASYTTMEQLEEHLSNTLTPWEYYRLLQLMIHKFTKVLGWDRKSDIKTDEVR